MLQHSFIYVVVGSHGFPTTHVLLDDLPLVHVCFHTAHLDCTVYLHVCTLLRTLVGLITVPHRRFTLAVVYLHTCCSTVWLTPHFPFTLPFDSLLHSRAGSTFVVCLRWVHHWLGYAGSGYTPRYTRFTIAQFSLYYPGLHPAPPHILHRSFHTRGLRSTLFAVPGLWFTLYRCCALPSPRSHYGLLPFTCLPFHGTV